jgi:hypothetical protein
MISFKDEFKNTNNVFSYSSARMQQGIVRRKNENDIEEIQKTPPIPQ